MELKEQIQYQVIKKKGNNQVAKLKNPGQLKIKNQIIIKVRENEDQTQ